MRNLSRFILSVLLVFSLVACSSKLTNENLTKVKNGMNEKQVKEILGEPSSVETGELLGIRGTTFYYQKGESKIKIVFVNDSVMSKDGSFK